MPYQIHTHQTKQREMAVNTTRLSFTGKRTMRIYQAEFSKSGQTTFSLLKADTKNEKPLSIYLKKKLRKNPQKHSSLLTKLMLCSEHHVHAGKPITIMVTAQHNGTTTFLVSSRGIRLFIKDIIYMC
jgi:hypothetical protein